MSTEQRVIRPYIGVELVQGLLDEVAIEFGPRRLDAGQRLPVPVLEYLTEKLVLVLGEGEDGIAAFAERMAAAVEEAGLDTDQVELVLVLRSSRLRIANVVWRRSVEALSQEHPRVLVADARDRPQALHAPFGGCDVLLYVALTEQLPPRPLRPHRRGTWLARTSWKVVTDLGEIGFTPLILTRDTREKFGLSDETLRFVHVEEEVLDPEAADAALSVYVDEEVLASLTVNARSKGAKLFQQQLFLDAMTAVVHTASRQMQKADASITYNDAEDSLLGRIVRFLARTGDTVDEERARSYWKAVQDDPYRVIGLIEAKIPRIRRSVLDTIGEGGEQ